MLVLIRTESVKIGSTEFYRASAVERTESGAPRTLRHRALFRSAERCDEFVARRREARENKDGFVAGFSLANCYSVL